MKGFRKFRSIEIDLYLDNETADATVYVTHDFTNKDSLIKAMENAIEAVKKEDFVIKK